MSDDDIIFPDAVKEYMQLQCNNREPYFSYEIIDRILSFHSAPWTVLEIGCGIGRGSVLMNQRLSILMKQRLAICPKDPPIQFYLLDGDSNKKGQVAGLNNTTDDFYNSLNITSIFCEANKLNNFTLLNAEKDWCSNDLPIFDLIFSLRSIGFHWPLSLYLTRLLPYVSDGTVLAFELRWLNLGGKDNHERLVEHGEWNLQQLKDIPLEHYQIVSCDFGRESLLVLKGIGNVESV